MHYAAHGLGYLQWVAGNPNAKLRTPKNGEELKECFKTCDPGDIIQLKPHIKYLGDFILEKNNVTLLGAEGSKVVGTAEHRGALTVRGNGCNLHNLTCTTTNVLVEGNRCNITGNNIRGRLSVNGDDNTVKHSTIDGDSMWNLQVIGKRNHFEGVRTQHGGLFSRVVAKDCLFKNCSFQTRMDVSVIHGCNNQFEDVDFGHGVRMGTRDIFMERCHGKTVYLNRKAQMQRKHPFKDCTFNRVVNEN